MRYPDGGGLTAEGRSRWERVRLQAAQMFAQDIDAGQIAGLLRVSVKPVYQRRRGLTGRRLAAGRTSGGRWPGSSR